MSQLVRRQGRRYCTFAIILLVINNNTNNNNDLIIRAELNHLNMRRSVTYLQEYNCFVWITIKYSPSRTVYPIREVYY